MAGVAIYAAGGGRGHLRRARELARRCARLGPATIWHDHDDAPDGVDAGVAHRRGVPDGGDVLVTDTFPGGRRGELAGVLARFRRRVLVRRYVRPGTDAFDGAAGAYHRVWLPYARATCEWDGAEPGLHVGPLVRRLTIAPVGLGGLGAPAPLAVLGDPARLPWDAAWPPGTRVCRAFGDALPPARRSLAIGAGHNTIYELRALGVPFRAYPLDRRYDDQHRRAARLGVGVWTPRDLDAWLVAGA